LSEAKGKRNNHIRTTQNNMSNNKIDWTKPVQTKENPPRRVNDIKRRCDQGYPIVGSVDDFLYTWTENGEHIIGDDRNDFNLENIPTPAWQLQPPPPGRMWHRVDGWTEEMLPQDYRPLLVGETGSYEHSTFGKCWISGSWETAPTPLASYCFYRTNRPFPPQPQAPPVLTQRTESILLTPPSEPIFSEATLRIKIEDEAAGEFLVFESLSNDGKLRLDPDEWPAFKASVEFMLSEIEKHKKL
jgi:hypothetical protein